MTSKVQESHQSPLQLLANLVLKIAGLTCWSEKKSIFLCAYSNNGYLMHIFAEKLKD